MLKITDPIQTTISSASSLHTGSHITPVYLNLYDLGGCNNTCIHFLGLSFYHCAVQTHSAEYGYMGHPYKFTGLYKTSKHDPRFHLYKIRNSIEIGWTWFNENEIDKIVNDLKPFYMGFDYHVTRKNSIHFAKYLLEQLSNDSHLKHLESIRIIQFPSYIDRARRLTETFQFLKIFDTEKEITEINILYFLYMKFQGNLKEICEILQCDTLEKLNRMINFLEQGIQQRKLPRFQSYLPFNLNNIYDYLYKQNSNLFNNEQITLTDIFHQFDTITLRGRTSIDRYLNQQISNNIPEDNNNQTNLIKYHFPQIHRSSQPQDISQNQDRTPLTSQHQSTISDLTTTSTPIFNTFQHLPFRTTSPIETVLNLQESPNLNVEKPSYSLINNRQGKIPFSSRRRKLPRDLELTNDLHKITNYNYTNNAIYFNEDIDSNA